MPKPWPFRIAVLATLNASLVLISGTLATTSASLVAPVTGNSLISDMGHRTAGLHGGSVLLILLVLFSFLETGSWTKKLGWGLCGAVVLQGLLGSTMPAAPAHWHGVAHATMAQLIIAGLTLLVFGTSAGWNREQPTIADYGWPSLRSMARALPVFVLLQVVLGAMFRQQVAGLMLHILGAMFVSLYILIVVAFTIQQCPQHSRLSPYAKLLMGLTFTQVFLGIAAFTVRSLPTQETNAVLSIAAAHIVIGALTVGLSIVLGITIRRDMTPKVATA